MVVVVANAVDDNEDILWCCVLPLPRLLLPALITSSPEVIEVCDGPDVTLAAIHSMDTQQHSNNNRVVGEGWPDKTGETGQSSDKVFYSMVGREEIKTKTILLGTKER